MRTNKLFATLLLLLSCSLHAAALQGKVVGVADGDTMTVLDATNTKHKILFKALTHLRRLRLLDKNQSSL
jgi:endonuclease YncB( thermonuclease family)